MTDLFRYNEQITQGRGKPTYFYRGYHRNDYGVVTHFVATSSTNLKLKKISARTITSYHRNWKVWV